MTEEFAEPGKSKTKVSRRFCFRKAAAEKEAFLWELIEVVMLETSWWKTSSSGTQLASLRYSKIATRAQREKDWESVWP